VIEVPIVFTDREVGHSKMSRAIVAEAVWKVPWLRVLAARGALDAQGAANQPTALVP
jgi:apolipoprotein N-acyltransferase